MRNALMLSILFFLAVAGCRGPRPEPPPPPDTACQAPGHHYVFLGTDTTIYRQGATVRLTPTADMAPAGTADIPHRCTSDWKVEGPAALSGDRTTLTIAPDAAPGAIVAVSFLHLGKTVTGRFQVIGRDEIVLTGRRSQQSVEGCSAGEPVRELEFMPGSRFSVTFQPFETYRDYWGSYSFDPVSGALKLSVEGGNFVPGGLDLEGQAELKDGRLTLRGLYLGSRQGPPPARSCTYIF